MRVKTFVAASCAFMLKLTLTEPQDQQSNLPNCPWFGGFVQRVEPGCVAKILSLSCYFQTRISEACGSYGGMRSSASCLFVPKYLLNYSWIDWPSIAGWAYACIFAVAVRFQIRDQFWISQPKLHVACFLDFFLRKVKK